MSYKPSSPQQSARGHVGLVATAFQNPRPWGSSCALSLLGSPQRGHSPCLDSGLPPAGRPLGDSGGSPTPPLALAAAAALSGCPGPRHHSSLASPKPACARTPSVVLGQTRPPYDRGWGPGLRARVSGSRRMAPKQPLHARSSSEAEAESSGGGQGAAAPRDAECVCAARPIFTPQTK